MNQNIMSKLTVLFFVIIVIIAATVVAVSLITHSAWALLGLLIIPLIKVTGKAGGESIIDVDVTCPKCGYEFQDEDSGHVKIKSAGAVS